jgi:hypothetical protein
VDPLSQLRIVYRRYVISCDPHRDPPRYTAIARELATSPWCVITDDVDELRRILDTGQ